MTNIQQKFTFPQLQGIILPTDCNFLPINSNNPQPQNTLTQLHSKGYPNNCNLLQNNGHNPQQKYTNSTQQYGDWLKQYDWQYFGTFTTGYEMTIRTARRSMQRFYDETSKAGKTRMFWVAEEFELKDGFHTHALITVPDCLQYKNLIDIWQKVSGGKNKGFWNRIDLQKYDKRRGAGYYVGKYVTKKLTDYDLLTICE